MRVLTGRVALLAQAVGWPGLGLLAAARLGTASRAWQLDFVDTWASYPLAAWPTLGLLAWRLRSPALGLLGAAGTALALDSARRVVAVGRAAPVSGAARLRVMSANVLATNPSAAALLALIAVEDPDVVMLQEVRPVYAADLLGAASRLPHRLVEAHERYGGAALLSRWPLAQTETFLLADTGHACQRAAIQVAGHEVELFNIHLDTPYELYTRRPTFPRFGIRHRPGHSRDRQVDELIDLVERLDGPVVVCGDFNTAAGSHPHRKLLGHLRDAFLEAGRGLGLTWPRPVSIHGLVMPVRLLRIDYALFRGPLRPLAIRTLAHEGSDHQAIVADFAL